MHPHHSNLIPPHPISGFSLLEALTALAIFSGSYLALVSAHTQITSHTQKQMRELHALIATSNQHEIQVALLQAEADE